MIGPTRGDVYCDRLGRILVRFRWAEGDGSFSGESGEGVCWVHWLERWGGDGYGTQTLPRVGSEVLVDVLRGWGADRGRADSFARERACVSLATGGHEGRDPHAASCPTAPRARSRSTTTRARRRSSCGASGDFDTQVARNTTAELSGTYDLTVGEERRESTNGGRAS